MGNYSQYKNVNTTFGGSDGIVVPTGTTNAPTDGRPGSPNVGNLRYNTTTGLPEFYTASGWNPIAPSPTITTISGTINENTSSTLTVNGTSFATGSIVSINGPATGNTDRPLVTTFVNSGQVTADTNASNVTYVGAASFDVKVLNPSGLSASLAAAGVIDRDPIWSTSAGSLGNYTGPASGGVVTEYVDGATTYRVHTFYYSGSSTTFTVNNAITADIMLLAGGGGGHGGYQSPGGGGGGAGGLVYYNSRPLSSGSYTLSVGAGGTGGFSDSNRGGGYYRGTEGGNTTFTGLTTAVGGGAGGGYPSEPSTTGGSGGGNNYWGDGSSLNRAGTSNQGNQGGQGITNDNQNGGAGGGAGGAGGNAASGSGNAGAGGAGVQEGTSTVYNFQTGSTTTFKINGTSNVYAGGGGGGQGFNSNNIQQSNARPLGGGVGSTYVGGEGGRNYECNLNGGEAVANRGAGGGGGGGNSSTGGAADNVDAYGGYGSSGLVAIRYAISNTSYTPLSVSASDPDGSSVTYAISSGSLPTGLSLNTSTGAITGYPTSIPATDTAYPVTITANSNTQVVPRNFSITVQTRPADSDAGGGYSIAQGADGTNITGYTTTSMTKYENNCKNQGSAPLDTFNYAAGTGSGFAYHCGHLSTHWAPRAGATVAINVTSATYGKVLNQFQWVKHANACGTVRFYGSNQAITSGNYLDTSYWTYLGQGHAGGYGSATDGTVITININPNNYGYKWYMHVVIDNTQGSAVGFPQIGNRGTFSGNSLSWSGGWAMYGARYNKV